MSLDVIERKQLFFPQAEGLPYALVMVHRGKSCNYQREAGDETKTDSLMSLLVDGTVIKTENGIAHKLETGSLYISFDDEPVSLQAYQETPHRVIAFLNKSRESRKQLKEIWHGKRMIKEIPMVQVLVKAIRDELLNTGIFQTSILSTYYQSLLTLITRETCSDEHHKDSATRLYNRALHLITCFPERVPTLYELCKELDVSKEHIIRIFKSNGATSPYQLMLKTRMERAIDWLENTDWSISEIAEKLGYSNSSSFIRSFSQFTGSTPGRTRKRLS